MPLADFSQSPATLLGLVARVRVRHVYAVDRFSLQLFDSAGRETADDITLQLPVRGSAVLRPGDPPAHALLLYDPDAADGRTSMAPGPCPLARRWAQKQIDAAAAVIMHVPIPSRSGWLESLVPGSIEIGDLYLLHNPPPSGERCSLAASVPFSELLLSAGHAADAA